MKRWVRQQQQIGVVRALALRPRLLLFDEPTSALDPERVGVAHEVAFVDGGTIVERGDPALDLRKPQHERTRQVLHRLLHPF